MIRGKIYKLKKYNISIKKINTIWKLYFFLNVIPPENLEYCTDINKKYPQKKL